MKFLLTKEIQFLKIYGIISNDFIAFLKQKSSLLSRKLNPADHFYKERKTVCLESLTTPPPMLMAISQYIQCIVVQISFPKATVEAAQHPLKQGQWHILWLQRFRIDVKLISELPGKNINDSVISNCSPPKKKVMYNLVTGTLHLWNKSWNRWTFPVLHNTFL